jgi:hypothetical protein
VHFLEWSIYTCLAKELIHQQCLIFIHMLLVVDYKSKCNCKLEKQFIHLMEWKINILYFPEPPGKDTVMLP